MGTSTATPTALYVAAMVVLGGASAAGGWLLARDDRVPWVVSAPCDDGDPCTLDRYHREWRQCVHVPDALCTKPCASDADCAYPEATAPCLQAECVAGSCRYMRIAVDECVRCGPERPCAGTFCDPRDCRGGFCRRAPRRCDDADPLTRDRCDEAGAACRHDLADGERGCSADADCATDHACERLRCAAGRCRVTPETAGCGTALDDARRCERNTDCIQRLGDRCFAGPCRRGFCEWREVAHSQCLPCTGDQDCRGTYCLWPICTGTVCVTEEVPFCLDDNPDTRDVCSDALRACIHTWTRTPPSCVAPPQSDGATSTVDLCHSETGETVHLPSDGTPCGTTNKCWTTYAVAEGHCVGRPLDCHHDDACVAQCDPRVGCVLDENQDCHCRTDADCDLGNPCARVYCMPSDGGACWGTFIDDCVPCQSDADCLADGWCVLGHCNAKGYCTYQDGRTCDDGDPNTFGFCHGQRDDPCTYEPLASPQAR